MKNLDQPGERHLTPLVGRQQEMQVLQLALQNLCTRRQPGMIFLSGEAGVGKSRLAIEFCCSINEEASVIYSGQCLANQPVVAYWVFLDLLRNSLGVNGDTPPAEVSQKLNVKVTELMKSQVMETLPYLEYLLSLPSSDPSIARRVEFLDPDRLRQRIFLAVRNYLEALANRKPIVLVLEDLLEADEPSLDLLISLFELWPETPLLILALSRPFLKGKLKRVRDAAMQRLGESCQNLYLSHLTSEDCQAILNQFLGPNDLPERMRRNIIEQSQGIPFYIEEIVRMLIDVGVLRRIEDQWQAAGTADLERLGIPESLQSLVRWRFERLEPLQRQVLQAASIIGRQFHRQILYSVLQPGGSVEVDEQVKKICARGFFVEPVESDIPILEFRHNLTAEIVSTTIEESDRARLHGRVGRALEVYYAGQLSTQVDLLAHHFGRSDQEGPALHYCALAGQRAARRYLNEQARQYFETALSLLSRLPHGSLQAVEIFMGLGDVLLLIGEYQQARLKFESALQALMGESKTSVLGHTCTLHRKIGNTCERQGDFEQALQYLKKARKMVEDPARPFPAEESQVLSDLGWIHFRLGNFKEAETNLIHALSLAQQARRYDVTASIYNRLGGIYWQKDDLEKATNFVQKSIALREEIGDMVAVARSYNNLGLLDWKRGKWDSALECFNRSLSMHANFGDIEGIIDVHGNLGLLQLDRGSIVEARTHMEESLAKARQIGHNYIVAMTLMYFSRLHIVLENWKTALDYAQQSWQAFEGMGARDELIDVFTLLGQAHLGLEDLSQAKSWADKTFELLPKDQDGMLLLRTDDTGRALRMMGEVQRRLNYFDQAERWLNASMEVFNRLGNKLEQARTMASQAALAADRGDMASSRVLLNEARLMLRALGANLDLQHLDRISGQVSLAALQ